MRKIFFSLMIAALLLVTISCTGGGNAVSPVTEPEMILGTSSHEEQNQTHSLWGLWQFVADPTQGTLDVIPLRDSDLHLNALKFLEPPPYLYLTLESPVHIDGNILDVDIGIRHPFLNQKYTGFDVCGIVFTHGSVTGFSDPDIVMAGEGDTRLLNADGYTRWWNPVEFPHGDTIFNYKDGLLGTPSSGADFNCTVNGYRYFSDDLGKNALLDTLDPANRGVFSAGQQNVRHYKIDLSGGLVFNYAVDVCWKKPQGGPPYTVDDFPPEANRPEAYYISVTELENGLNYDEIADCTGGYLKLRVDVFDHHNADLNEVYGESLEGLSLDFSPFPVGGGEGYSTYELDFTGENIAHTDEIEILIAAQSEATGYGGILPDKAVTAYSYYPVRVKRGWARTVGSSFGSDEGFAITSDNLGNVYITGFFAGGADFDPGPGSDYHGPYYGFTAFLSKFDTCGDLVWARTWGREEWDPDPFVYTSVRGNDVAVGPSGDVYVTGEFRGGTIDFDPGPPAENHVSNGDIDVFLSKFDADGNFQWVRTWGSTYDPNDSIDGDVGEGVDVDDYGNVYVIGEFFETLDFDPGPAIDNHTSNGGRDLFLSKFDTNGNFQWARTWGGPDFENIYGIAVHDSGNAYVTGTFHYGIVDFDPGPGVAELDGDETGHIFVSKFNSNGDFQWVRAWGCGLSERVYGIAVDNYENIHTTGYFGQTVDFDPGPGVDEHMSGGYLDAFLSRLSSNGDYQGVLTWGGEHYINGRGVTIDGNGNAYVTGYFYGQADFNPGPGTDYHNASGVPDSYLSKFSPTGEFLWARTWGGDDECIAFGVTADCYGNAYTTGYFHNSVDFDPSPGTEYHTASSWQDIFIHKIPPDGNW